MLKCRHIVDQSSDYLGHEMSFGKRLEFRMHLLMCHHCRRFIRQFRAAVRMTRRLPKTPVSQEQINVVLHQIDTLDE